MSRAMSAGPSSIPTSRWKRVPAAGIIPVDSAALPPTLAASSRRVTVRSSFSQAASVAVSPHPPAPRDQHVGLHVEFDLAGGRRPPRSRRLASAAAALYRANSYHGEETTPRKSTGRRGVAVRVPTLISPSPRRWRLFPSAPIGIPTVGSPIYISSGAYGYHGPNATRDCRGVLRADG